ncbi:DUF1990 family protein [Nocardia harenae]|uniref:DUF1990 family protein n=1 Tax=Nocardia harenae TaxID=358707 RepID=UPI0008333D8D|nr:DUF1990 domain-containing protein [Nocardia harenae]
MTDLTYGPPGATRPADPQWHGGLPGHRRYERTVAIGAGAELWERAGAAVLAWGVKRRSGFRVAPDERVSAGADYEVRFGPIREPVRVVAVVDEPDRHGFAYGTRSGHPVSGEEAFIAHRDRAGTVYLTLRSLTAPASHGPWRGLFPLLLLAQYGFRYRYLRALR